MAIWDSLKYEFPNRCEWLYHIPTRCPYHHTSPRLFLVILLCGLLRVWSSHTILLRIPIFLRLLLILVFLLCGFL